ncbi:hypothetical protein RQN30_03010 [Arcanobacterium hippocoleae]
MKNSTLDPLKYINDTKTPRGPRSSVRYGNTARLDKAQEQARLSPTPVEEIINYVNEFLLSLGMKKCENPKHTLPDTGSDDAVKLEEHIDKEIYAPIRACKDITCKDIVWMKFTDKGFLGVVAVSNDINFDIPKPEDTHLCKRNTSGIIVQKLGQDWDRSFVLVFPLHNIPKDLTRSDIETGIGNYLIEKKVPILDYYSHRYQFGR